MKSHAGPPGGPGNFEAEAGPPGGPGAPVSADAEFDDAVDAGDEQQPDVDS